MIIGVPKEIKDGEYRVAMTPETCKSFISFGHEVLVQAGAGTKIGYSDELYKSAGARIVATAKEVYTAEMIIKVKEPQSSEFSLLKSGQILFGYLHLAPDFEQTKALLKAKVVGIAYDTVTDLSGTQLPLLIPMSEIAGRVSVQAGAAALQLAAGGKGVCLGGVPGVKPGKVVIIGGGVSGTQAARMAMGLGADVTILDNNLTRLRHLDDAFGPTLRTLYSNSHSIAEAIEQADLVIGAVLIPGATAPKLITREMIRSMQPGSVFVDIAIDQGGCSETSKPTTHSSPTYVVDGVVHYCVTNIPGAVARTSTQALTNATLVDALAIANKGWEQALHDSPGLRNGLNVCNGHITYERVAEAHNMPYTPAYNFCKSPNHSH